MIWLKDEKNLIVHGWGLATGDFDKDGDVDVVVGVEDIVWSEFGQLETDYARHTQTLFLRNDSSTAKANGALSVQLKQPKTANPFAVGARVDVSVDGYSAIRFVFGGSPYLSTHRKSGITWQQLSACGGGHLITFE